MSFLLFSTEGCHLCEEAKAMIDYAQQHGDIDKMLSFEVVDIVEEQQWVNKYGERIPVILSQKSNRELGWPFQYGELIEWVRSQEGDLS
ncbi:glutaredoxin family protein [Pleionea sp. CnH1-48]|uniref:glutaredoxin family protein n=1 Tax=Pleionea sp. CnH1-48 TaxID=2954494 RepID=UPI0020973879|nr:glutaredoxin family protein [Pleionea sp. CnH1-48]MCO7225387.1 glutaredoxin family protein [Pleionea sp. CnH1-48]